MKKFFSNKYNIALVVMSAVSVLVLSFSGLVSVFVPIGLFCLGITFLYVAFLLIKKRLHDEQNKASDFINKEDVRQKRKQSFLEKEGTANLIISITGFLIFGVLLIYMGFKLL